MYISIFINSICKIITIDYFEKIIGKEYDKVW